MRTGRMRCHAPPSFCQKTDKPKLVGFLSKPQDWYGITRQRVWNRGRRMASPSVYFLRLDSTPSCDGFHSTLRVGSMHAFRRDCGARVQVHTETLENIFFIAPSQRKIRVRKNADFSLYYSLFIIHHSLFIRPTRGFLMKNE